MGNWRFWPVLTILLAIAVTGGTAAQAGELVAGDYGALPGPANSPFPENREAEAVTPFVIAFTPRATGNLRLRAPSRLLAGGRLDFGIGKGGLLGIERLGLQRPPAGRDGDQMLVGGGFEYNGLAFGGAYGRSLLMGRQADLVAAGVGYGSFSASLGYAWGREPDEEPLDMLMLSTDLLALPWLAFESDVAVGEAGRDEAIAVGRLGIRLNF